MEQADKEVLVVEQRPLLAGQVELREFEAQFVVNVLQCGAERGSVSMFWINLFFGGFFATTL